jgi:hypothetical protein
MNTALRRLPGFAIAIVALALSASLVFAGQPAGNVGGLGTAANHALKTVPVVTTSDNEGADEDTDTETETDEDTTETDTDTETETDEDTTETDTSDSTDSSDSADNCTVDLTQDPSVLAALNHGSVVCSAAQATTWDTALYKNKGAWVSHWAKMNHGHDPNKQHGHSANH